MVCSSTVVAEHLTSEFADLIVSPSTTYPRVGVRVGSGLPSFHTPSFESCGNVGCLVCSASTILDDLWVSDFPEELGVRNVHGGMD